MFPYLFFSVIKSCQYYFHIHACHPHTCLYHTISSCRFSNIWRSGVWSQNKSYRKHKERRTLLSGRDKPTLNLHALKIIHIFFLPSEEQIPAWTLFFLSGNTALCIVQKKYHRCLNIRCFSQRMYIQIMVFSSVLLLELKLLCCRGFLWRGSVKVLQCFV